MISPNPLRSCDLSMLIKKKVMNFVPQKGNPMETRIPLDPAREMMITTIMRFAFPDRLILASLDVGGLVGLRPCQEYGFARTFGNSR